MDQIQDAKGRKLSAVELMSRAEIEAAVAAEATLARNGDNLTTGTVADARIASTIARDSEVAAAYQPLDADLTTIAGLTPTTDNVIQSVAGSWASRTMAQLKTTLALVKGDVGLGSVDNTADTAKPVSTAQQAALDLKRNSADVWRRELLLNTTPNTITGGTWTYNGTTGFNTNGVGTSSWSNIWFTDITAGTWAIDLYVFKSPNGGIITFEYSTDAGSNWTTLSASVDLYAAANTNFVITTTGIVIAAAGRLDIRIRNATVPGTKNGSSSAYYCLSSAASLRRTA
jgi:hypothetical protein